jgi:hypothetical protein
LSKKKKRLAVKERKKEKEITPAFLFQRLMQKKKKNQSAEFTVGSKSRDLSATVCVP